MAKATPEQIVELKKIDKDFEVKMKELDVDLYNIQTKDIQDARDRFANDWTPKIYCSSNNARVYWLYLLYNYLPCIRC